MRRALLLALLAAACSKKQSAPLPVINSFAVDNANPEQGDTLTFSWDVTGATSLILWPQPGPVTGNTVSFAPNSDGQFILEATNAAGTVQKPVDVKFLPTTPVAVSRFSAIPAQVSPGAEVTLSWSLTAAVSATLSDGSSNAPIDALNITTLKVHPTATTVYTLTAQAKAGHKPASATAKAVARVAPATVISSFTATATSITQGDSITLAWTGNATSWSVSDGTTPVQLGPLQSLVVRPASTTTYTLTGSGPGGSDSRPLTITVEPHAATALTYTPPPSGTQPLRIVPLSCAGAATCTLALVAHGTVPLRGVAVDLPADSTKIAVTGKSTSLGAPTPAFQVALGAGPLNDTLVLGAALPGDGSQPSADATFNDGDQVAQFTLSLAPSAGRGPVFIGAPRAWVQSAAGRATVAIAVGTLDAN